MSSDHSDRRQMSLEGAIRFFEKCKSKVVTRGNIKLQLSLDTVKREAEQSGLEPQHFSPLVDAAASGNFAQTVSRQLIRCLIPRTTVPQDAVIKAVSWMSTNKPAIAVQALLLRWVLVVYDYIDGHDKLHCLYGVLFLFVESQIMMPHVCHLLFLLTRKEDVKLFRIHKLLSLIRERVGPQPYLLGLLTIYKLYYPNLVSFALPASNKTFFGSYDRKWKSQVREMVERGATGQVPTQAAGADLSLSTSRSRQLTSAHPPRKKRRVEIPSSNSMSADTETERTPDVCSLSIDTNRIPFVRIDSFVNLLQSVDKIEFPSQIASCLRDPLLQHVMAYSADRVVTARFTFWLQHALTEEFINHSPKSTEENERLLELLVKLTDFLQEGIPVVDKFLAAFLHTWNGTSYRLQIFRLLTRLQMYPFDKLNELFLEPLRQLYCSSSVYFKCQCLLALTELMRNYVLFHCPQLKVMETQPSEDPSVHLMFPERLTEGVQRAPLLSKMAAFVDRLAVTGMQLEGDNPLLLHVIVSYTQLISSMTGHAGVDFMILPSPSLVRLILFSSSATAISMLAHAFCRYKEAFNSSSKAMLRTRESVSLFNAMLVDMCDALWRNKAFNNPLQGSLKTLSGSLGPLFTSQAITAPSTRFSIFMGQAFLSFAWSFLKQTQPQGKKVHPNQLMSVKDSYLLYLRQHHLEGVVHFINSFINRRSLSTVTLSQSSLSSPPNAVTSL